MLAPAVVIATLAFASEVAEYSRPPTPTTNSDAIEQGSCASRALGVSSGLDVSQSPQQHRTRRQSRDKTLPRAHISRAQDVQRRPHRVNRLRLEFFVLCSKIASLHATCISYTYSHPYSIFPQLPQPLHTIPTSAQLCDISEGVLGF